MAGSRLEKIGTIFSRTKGLIKSGAMKWDDRPLWYDVYEAFPPKDEPRYDRPAPDIPVKSIFYAEDKIRAAFHDLKSTGTINILNPDSKTKTQKFISIYKDLENTTNMTNEELFNSSLDALNKEFESDQQRDQLNKSSSNIVETFKDAQEQSKVGKVDMANIFKD